MELILWRHAEAEDGFPDMTRALTAKGHKQAKQMAGWLKPRLPKHVQILASPAKRAQQTAAALELDFTTCREVAPGASAQALLAAARWPDNTQDVLIIGHQPTLGELAALLLSDADAGFSIRKGAVWWLSNRVRGEAQYCQLRAAMTPDLV